MEMQFVFYFELKTIVKNEVRQIHKVAFLIRHFHDNPTSVRKCIFGPSPHLGVLTSRMAVGLPWRIAPFGFAKYIYFSPKGYNWKKS
jgi:hypothetical protein